MTLWQVSWKADPLGAAIADRHYSRRTPGAPQFVPPGRSLVLTRPDALWVTSWPEAVYTRHEWPGAWVCSAFRNEGPTLSSELITDAVAATRWRFPNVPDLGMITFVDETKIRHKRDPGRCFRRAGFVPIGRTKDRDLLVLQLVPEAMPQALAPAGTDYELEALP